MNFKDVLGKLSKSMGTKIIFNLTALYFFSIAMAIKKKYALHLNHYFSFLKEMSF
jgi:hypothetical protein